MTKKIQSYTEAEMIGMFGLTRVVGNAAHALMTQWLTATASLSIGEQELFEIIFNDVQANIIRWQEEELKMLFISPLLILGHLKNTEKYLNFFDRPVEGVVNGYFLKVKPDFMIATGSLGKPDAPYFHFQEYKPFKNPSGDSMGQLLEALLIAQSKNGQSKNTQEKPLYGCEVLGSAWRFVILKGQTYYVSNPFDCTERDDLLKIIAILRNFKHILETQLLGTVE